MRVPNDDPTRSFQREMQRAERERKQMLVIAAGIGVVVLAAGMVVAGIVFGRAAKADAARAEAKTVAAAPAVVEESTDAATAEEGQAPAPAETAEETLPEPKPEASEPQPEPEPAPKAAPKPAPKPAVQRFSIAIGQYGYEPAAISAKAGVPIRLTVAQGEGCAAGFLIASLNVAADNSSGPAVVDLPALAPGRYRYSCGMDMVRGTLVVQ